MKKIANLRIFPTTLAGMIVRISFIILTDLWLPVTVAALAFTVAAALSVALYKKNRQAMKSAVVFCVSFAVGIAFGLAAAGYANASLERKEIFAKDVLITGKIEVGNSSDLSGKVASDTVVLTDLTIGGQKAEGKAGFYSATLAAGDFYEGDVITFVGTVTTVSADITTPYKASALADGIIYEITHTDDEEAGEIEKTGESLGFFDKIKKAVAGKLSENAPDKSARFMYAMLFGDSSVIDESVMSDFSYTGTAHLLAVSGLHVGMVAGALFLLLKKLRAPVWVRSVTVTVALAAVCALCAFSQSSVRAALMVVTGMIAGLCGLRYDRLSGMSLAAIILLFVSPFNLYSVGFLMSFLAVYGLILFAAPLKKAMVKVRIPAPIAGALSATIAANVTLMPLMIYVFGDVSLVFALANCLIVPAAGVFFPLYIFTLPFAFIPHFGFVISVVSLPFTAAAELIGLLAGVNFPAVYFNFSWATIVLWLAAATALSSISAVPLIAKKICASVLVICFIAAVVVQNAGMLSYENKVTCFSSYGCAGALVQSRSEGDFLIFEGELDEYAAEAALEAMEKNRLRKVDFVVTYELTAEEAEVYREYCAAFGDATLYCDYAEGVVYSGLVELTFNASVICTATYTSVYLGGTDLLLTAYPEAARSSPVSDVVICPWLTEIPDGAKYLVSQSGYVAGGKNCLPSDFTFWTDGDRIIKTNKWRFA